ncbi:unnamed protein product, partial [Nesidiocoris tenuis]
TSPIRSRRPRFAPDVLNSLWLPSKSFNGHRISSFWALVVVYNLIKRYHKQPSKICAVKKRPLPPKELLDPELGNHSVVAVDMRGYGDSDKPPSVKYYNMKYLIGDVKNLIEGLGAFFGPIGYYRANIFSGANKLKKPDANSVEFPKTFLIFGDDDVAIDSKVVELSKKFCPNLTTEIVPGGCHFVHEEEPEIVNAKIKQFLSA